MSNPLYYIVEEIAHPTVNNLVAIIILLSASQNSILLITQIANHLVLLNIKAWSLKTNSVKKLLYFKIEHHRLNQMISNINYKKH